MGTAGKLTLVEAAGPRQRWAHQESGAEDCGLKQLQVILVSADLRRDFSQDASYPGDPETSTGTGYDL